MSAARPDGAKRAGRNAEADRTFEEKRDGREAALWSWRPSEQGDAAQARRAACGDEILRTERGRGKDKPAANRPTPIHGQDVPVRAGGGERFPEPRHGPPASGSADETYGGWLPTGVLLTPGEALAAVLVAKIGWGGAMVVLALAERLAELPEPLAGYGLASTFLFGLACGLYVLLRLRSHRLAWRRQLRGEL